MLYKRHRNFSEIMRNSLFVNECQDDGKLSNVIKHVKSHGIHQHKTSQPRVSRLKHNLPEVLVNFEGPKEGKFSRITVNCLMKTVHFIRSYLFVLDYL